MSLDHLTLQITENCPLECAYCCVESGPRKTETMQLDDARSYVRQAKELNPNFVLSFTGGEPFARFELMRSIAEYAHDLGIWHTTITSAVWCKSEAFAVDRFLELQSRGLRTLTLSYDSFHQPWVSLKKAKNCVAAATSLGLTVIVAGSITKISKGAVALMGEWLKQYPTVKVLDGPVQPNGRGAQLATSDLLVTNYSGCNLCCTEESDLTIYPDGTTYPCCSTGGSYDHLILGNAKETSLAELRNRVESARWFEMITRHGFAQLESLVKIYYSEVSFPENHLGVCNLCSLVFDKSELGDKVRDVMRLTGGKPLSQLDKILWFVSSVSGGPKGGLEPNP